MAKLWAVAIITESRATKGDENMKWFSLAGRATRSQWWGVNIVGCVAALFVAIGIGCPMMYIYDGESESIILTVALAVLASLAYFVISFAVTIRRLHDRGRSGWFYLVYVVLNMIPFVNFIAGLAFLIDMGFLDGVHGPNQWGEDPKGRAAPGSGKNVVINVAQNNSSGVGVASGARFCSQCGTAIDASSQFCAHCGKAIK